MSNDSILETTLMHKFWKSTNT